MDTWTDADLARAERYASERKILERINALEERVKQLEETIGRTRSESYLPPRFIQPRLGDGTRND